MTNQEIFRQNFRVQARRFNISKEEVQAITPEVWSKLEAAAEKYGSVTSRRTAAGLVAAWGIGASHPGVVKTVNDRRCITVMVSDMVGQWYNTGTVDTYHAPLQKLLEAGYKPDSMLIVLAEAAVKRWHENKTAEGANPSIVNKVLQQVKG